MFTVGFSYPHMRVFDVFTRIATDEQDLQVLLEDLEDSGADIEFIEDYK